MSLTLHYHGEETLLTSLPSCNSDISFLVEGRVARLHRGKKSTCLETDLLASIRHNCMVLDKMQAMVSLDAC